MVMREGNSGLVIVSGTPRISTPHTLGTLFEELSEYIISITKGE